MRCRYLDGILPNTNELPVGLFANTPLLEILGLGNMGLVSLDPQLFGGLTALHTLYAACSAGQDSSNILLFA